MTTWQDIAIDVFEEGGASCTFYDDYCEIEFYSPAGEDFVMAVSADSAQELWSDLSNQARCFNPDAHAANWYGANQGEPSSLRVLLDDAEAIASTLCELTNALAKSFTAAGIWFN